MRAGSAAASSNASYRPGATDLRGLATYLRLAKDGGSFNWEAQANVRTPGFEVNDISFLSRADYVQLVGNVAYNWTKPTAGIATRSFIAGAQQAQNFDGDLTNRDVHVFLGSCTPQFWRWNVWALRNFQAYDDRLMRGGPVAVLPDHRCLLREPQHRLASRVVFNVNPRYQRNREGGFQSAVNTSMRWKPVSNVSLSLGPSYNFTRGIQQYVTTIEDATNTAFAGNRYVFSSLVQKTLSMDTRLAVTFTPNSSLELYAQPFIASGDYSDFKEFDAPRQLRKSVYGRDRGTISPPETRAD